MGRISIVSASTSLRRWFGADDGADYFYPNFPLGLPVEENMARGLQRLLGNFMYGKALVVNETEGGTEDWMTFGKQARVLNITASGFEMGATVDDVERCRKVNAILQDAKNGI
jgi:hypothetical protein